MFMRLVKENTNYDFLGKKWYFIALSAVVILAGLLSILLRGGLRYGIDFAGGTEVRLSFVQPPVVGDLRERLSGLGLGEATIQTFGGGAGGEQVLIHLERGESPEGATAGAEDEGGHLGALIVEALRPVEEKSQLSRGLVDLNASGRDSLYTLLLAGGAAADDPAAAGGGSANELADAIVDRREHAGGLIHSFEELAGLPGLSSQALQTLRERTFLGSFAVVGVDFVGPTVGHDLRQKATLATVWSLLGILVYLSFRFKFHYGIGAVVALFHDVLVTVGMMSIFNRQFDLTVIAALLTIVGFSVNDTIVIFDRVRENLKLMRRSKLPEIINTSVNQCLGRTLLTSLTVLLVVVSLFLLGGPVLNNFAFAMLVGCIAGVYSTVFIASPVVLAWQNMLDRRSRPHKR